MPGSPPARGRIVLSINEGQSLQGLLSQGAESGLYAQCDGKELKDSKQVKDVI